MLMTIWFKSYTVLQFDPSSVPNSLAGDFLLSENSLAPWCKNNSHHHPHHTENLLQKLLFKSWEPTLGLEATLARSVAMQPHVSLHT